ncbi:unnamed protein product [Caenorhabditis bovis]|uniref:Gustatory receptor n=1 Tax=Caenorhabditis bovis TaxID=2654633 RepID=A0A8S1E5G9_9PELO|nr:unnamed protein product [Caenorhabditis bovis]
MVNVMIGDHASRLNLLGPYRYVIKCTGLDCSIFSNSMRCFYYISTAFSILVILVQFFRMAIFIKVEAHVLSFAWAESNYFGFMSIHGMVCSLCIFGWTKNRFIPNLIDDLIQLSSLRISPNADLDNYKCLQLKCAIFSIPLFVVALAYSIYSAIQHKVLLGGNETLIYLYILMPILTFHSCLIISCTLAIYVIANVALTREVEYLNHEMEKAEKDHNLQNLNVISLFSLRQIQILKVIQRANNSLGSYGNFGPIFSCFAFVNGVYLTSFLNAIPIVPFVFLMLNVVVCTFITLLTFIPACKLQNEIEKTARLIMMNCEFEHRKDLYRIYRLMRERILQSDTALYVLNGIPIKSKPINIAIFIIPNIGALLLLLKKCLNYNGINF